MAYSSRRGDWRRGTLLLQATRAMAIQNLSMTGSGLAHKATMFANDGNVIVDGGGGGGGIVEGGVPFNETCNMGSFAYDAENATLGLYCNNDDWAQYSYDWSYLDLDRCVGNDGGKLVPYPDGNFSTSCQGCNVTWSHVYLNPITWTTTQSPTGWHAAAATTTVTTVSTPRWDDLYLGCAGCANTDGVMKAVTVDLNKVMTNNNGTIGCYTYTGGVLHAQPTTTTIASPKAAEATEVY